MEMIQKNDFIEIEFTGKYDENIFDTTNKDEAKKIGLESNIKPLIISAGNEMVVKGLDEDLIGKEIGKSYKIHITPENAFGKRNTNLIQLVPLKVFTKNKINPYPGLAVQLDNNIAKILSVSGGRITVDFNNPMAGKEVDYEYKVMRKINDINEKINSLQDYFFKNRFEFKLENNKVTFNNKELKDRIDMFKGKFKDMTGLEFEVREEKDKELKKEEIKPL
jgi:FKBP-type peptidyl-prolyl cis-trans isomerase 2